jgi:uncharacterized protein involved in exopolysaccharide biosynthesis
MKILGADKFQPKKRSKKEGLNSATPEAKEEDIRIDEEPENQSADGYAEQNVCPDLEPRTKDESRARVDPEPEGLSDQLSKAYANQQHPPEPEVFPEPQPEEPSEKSPQNETKTENLTSHGLQTFFESLPDENPEPLSQDMNLPNDLSDTTSEDDSKQQSEVVSVHLPGSVKAETRETRVAMQTKQSKQNSAENSASSEAMPSFEYTPISKSDRKSSDKPRRKKRGPDSTDGDSTKPLPFSLRDIFHLVFKRKVQILLFFLAVVITVTIGTLLAEPTYQASTQILVKLGRESVFVPTTGNTRPVIDSSREERINSEIEIIKSRSLAEKVVLALGPKVIYEDLKEQEPGIIDRLKDRIFPQNNKELTPDERAALNLEKATANFQKNLNVNAVKLSNIVQVSLQHQNPRMVAMVVNKLAEIYLGHHLEVHKTPQSHKFFQEQSELLKNKLEQSETKLKELKKQHQITSLEQERTLLLEQASTLHADLNKTLSQEAEAEKRIRQLRRQLTVTPKTIDMGEVFDQNQNLIGMLETRLVELELEEKDLLAKYTDQNRLVQNIKEEIGIVKEKLAAQEKKSYGRKRSGANPTFQRVQEELYRNEAELNALKAKGQIQKSQLANYQVKLEKLNQIDVKLNQLQQQVDVNRENYRLYLTKFEESRISDAMDTEKIASIHRLSR